MTGVVDANGILRVGNAIPGAEVALGPYIVAWNTAGLTTGVALGDELVPGTLIADIGIVTTTGWNGTTPTMDVGSFSGTTGLFDNLGTGAVELADPYGATNDNAGIDHNGDSQSWLSGSVASVGAAGGAAFFPWQLRVSDPTQVFAVVSQDGSKGGTAAGATAGETLVYVVVIAPFPQV